MGRRLLLNIKWFVPGLDWVVPDKLYWPDLLGLKNHRCHHVLAAEMM